MSEVRFPQHGLYVLTDCRNNNHHQLMAKTRIILEAGIKLLQYRNKTDTYETRLDQASTLLQICADFNVPLIINDDIDLAATLSAQGIHLGSDDMPIDAAREKSGRNCFIGVSCYNDLARARSAAATGADYVAFGSFYPSDTKPDAVTAKDSLLKQASETLDIPIVAIGGITPDNAGPLLQNGAGLLAVSQAVYNHPDPADQVFRFNQLFNDFYNE